MLEKDYFNASIKCVSLTATEVRLCLNCAQVVGYFESVYAPAWVNNCTNNLSWLVCHTTRILRRPPWNSRRTILNITISHHRSGRIENSFSSTRRHRLRELLREIVLEVGHNHLRRFSCNWIYSYCRCQIELWVLTWRLPFNYPPWWHSEVRSPRLWSKMKWKQLGFLVLL